MKNVNIAVTSMRLVRVFGDRPRNRTHIPNKLERCHFVRARILASHPRADTSLDVYETSPPED